jgi:hypothetical protein
MTDPTANPVKIDGYHAHVYYDANTRALAERLRERRSLTRCAAATVPGSIRCTDTADQRTFDTETNCLDCCSDPTYLKCSR